MEREALKTTSSTHIFPLEAHQRVGRTHPIKYPTTFLNLVRELRVVVVQVRKEDVRLDRRLSEQYLSQGGGTRRDS